MRNLLPEGDVYNSSPVRKPASICTIGKPGVWISTLFLRNRMLSSRRYIPNLYPFVTTCGKLASDRAVRDVVHVSRDLYQRKFLIGPEMPYSDCVVCVRAG